MYMYIINYTQISIKQLWSHTAIFLILITNTMSSPITNFIRSDTNTTEWTAIISFIRARYYTYE